MIYIAHPIIFRSVTKALAVEKGAHNLQTSIDLVRFIRHHPQEQHRNCKDALGHGQRGDQGNLDAKREQQNRGRANALSQLGCEHRGHHRHDHHHRRYRPTDQRDLRLPPARDQRL